MQAEHGMRDRTGRWELSARIAAARFRKGFQGFSSAFMGRPFRPGSGARMLIYYAPNRISYAQVYPFFHYAQDLRHRLGLDVRALPVEQFLHGRVGRKADIIMVGPWFDVPPAQLAAALERLRDRHPAARLIFMDSYAHNDLRLGKALAPHVDLIVKKSAYADRSEFLRPRAGDTNLSEYYGLLYGTSPEPLAPDVPAELLGRVALCPGFLTAPQFITPFLTARPPDTQGRPIDVHSRIEQKGIPWYTAMRKAAAAAVQRIEGVTLTPPGRVSVRMFLDEMRESKLCWSPFGYGELCWRDVEAFLTGAVLIKPDMGHLETRPGLFVPGETYLPVKWDFSDLEQVVRTALANEGLRRHIAQRAFAVCRDFLGSAAFVDQYEPLLFPPGETRR